MMQQITKISIFLSIVLLIYPFQQVLYGSIIKLELYAVPKNIITDIAITKTSIKKHFNYHTTIIDEENIKKFEDWIKSAQRLKNKGEMISQLGILIEIWGQNSLDIITISKNEDLFYNGYVIDSAISNHILNFISLNYLPPTLKWHKKLS